LGISVLERKEWVGEQVIFMEFEKGKRRGVKV